MARPKIDRDSKEYLHIPFLADVPLMAEFDFTQRRERPESELDDNWTEADILEFEGQTVMRFLVEPEALNLAPGTHNIYVRLTYAPERVVKKAGQMVVL